MPVAPNGIKHVHLLAGATSEANEAALQAALSKYARDHNISNVSNLTVLGFENGYHGNSSLTQASSDPFTNF
jgi:4-aminobutyrate aminotransferase-like enzyme